MIYLRLIWSYLKIGFFGFGGGYAMLSLVQNEIVGPGWITDKTFTDIVAISQMTPGPIGINSATYIGYTAPMQAFGPDASPLWGLLGSIICTLVVIIPSFLLVRYAGRFVSRHRQSVAIEGIFRGLRPVVIGLIASAALILMNSENYGSIPSEIIPSALITLGVLLLNLFTRIHPILLICAAGVAGYLIF